MTAVQSINVRTVWISDVHLGYKDCKADFLLSFLGSLRCETLYLVGDIVDLWSLKKQFYWNQSHYEIIRTIHRLSQDGTRVIYIPGNHDACIRDFVDHEMAGIELHRQHIHKTADGKRFLVTHGDDFDDATRFSFLNRIFGDVAYDLLLFANRWTNRLRRVGGYSYWSLANYVKTRVGKAREAINAFEQAAIHEARRQGLDGIVCGHIHKADVRDYDGTLYLNDGDWVENCTALLEHTDGRIELLEWRGHAVTTRQTSAANDDVAFPTAGSAPLVTHSGSPS